MPSGIDVYVQELADALLAQEATLATAESCTGGWVAKVLTDRAGSSGWFDRGFVTYSNEAKREMLGVREQTLAAQGAVSEAVVREMAEGALAKSRATFTVAISGIAGPGGGSPDKPVGTVWLAWGGRDTGTVARVYRFSGDRDTVRRRSVIAAIEGLLERVGR